MDASCRFLIALAESMEHLRKMENAEIELLLACLEFLTEAVQGPCVRAHNAHTRVHHSTPPPLHPGSTGVGTFNTGAQAG